MIASLAETPLRKLKVISLIAFYFQADGASGYWAQDAGFNNLEMQLFQIHEKFTIHNGATGPFNLEDYLEGRVFSDDLFDLEADESETMGSTPTSRTPRLGVCTSTFGQDDNIDHIQPSGAQLNPGEPTKDPHKQKPGKKGGQRRAANRREWIASIALKRLRDDSSSTTSRILPTSKKPSRLLIC